MGYGTSGLEAVVFRSEAVNMVVRTGQGAKPQPESKPLPEGQNRQLQKQMNARVPKTGGASATRRAKFSTVSTLCKWLAKEGIRPNTPEEIKPKRIHDFVRAQLEKGRDPGTLKNQVGHLRQIVPHAFNVKDKQGKTHELSNKRLGIPERTREGTKRAITEREFRERLDQVKDPAIQAVLRLEYEIGLRGLEAIRCGDWLPQWKRDLDAGRPYINVSAGTKGGKPRVVDVTHNREHIKAAVENALKLVGKDGYLVQPPPPRQYTAPGRVNRSADQPLKRAQSYYARECRKAGFVGELAPHSARYAFTGKQIEAREATGMPRDLAVRLTSQDLGHGDGRGQYVDSTYDRKVAR